MTTIACRDRAWGVYFVAALLALGCGGRTVDDLGARGTSGDGTTPPTDPAVPTCNEICRRAVDICVPGGVIDQCVRDCEKMRSDYQKDCAALLDTFLRCRMKSSVLCIKEVTFEGCTDELNALVRCKS